jgi:hypothetical protein
MKKVHNIAVMTNETFAEYQKRMGIKPATNVKLNTPAPIPTPAPVTEEAYNQPVLFKNEQEEEHCMQNPKTLYDILHGKVELPEKEKMPEQKKTNEEAYIAPTLSTKIKKV